MIGIVLVLAAIYLIYSAFAVNLILGVAVLLGLLAYGYFKWYPALCTLHARKIYRKDPDGALKCLKSVEKRMNIQQLLVYAYYLLREGQKEESESIYNRLLAKKLKPDMRLKIRADYAVLLTKTGRIDEAIAELEEITLNYTNTLTYGSLGYLYILKDNLRKARTYNLEAYDYNSDDPVILDNMVQLYVKQGDYNRAKRYAEELLAKKPYFVEAYYDTAFVYIKLGDFARAKELLDDARCCNLTFMSTVKASDLDAMEKAINEKNKEAIEHKLGKFTQSEEIAEEDTINLPVIEDDEPEEYISVDDDPFI